MSNKIKSDNCTDTDTETHTGTDNLGSDIFLLKDISTFNLRK